MRQRWFYFNNFHQKKRNFKEKERKKDGTFRTILNLKHLNHYVNYQHFKVESLNVFKIIKGVWMTSVDLKDAFFTVPVH